MALKITTGRQPRAARIVLYGVEGIGKTTLAAAMPGALILDTEDGASLIDCHRVAISSWTELRGAIMELAREAAGYQTIVIDSADWAESHLVNQILSEAPGKRSLEDFGFGKGYVMLAERMRAFLADCDQLVRAGLNVVFLAHSKVVRCSPPDQTDGYDRYELKLTKQVAPILREWCDALLFANYRTKLVEGSDGRKKARGSQRVLYAERSASHDAKNRYGLPAELEMTADALAPLFPAAKPASAQPDTAAVMTKASRAIAKAVSSEELRGVQRRIDARLADDTLTAAQWECLTDQLAAKADELAVELVEGVAE